MPIDGFTTVILLILLIGSVLMFSVGLIGIYVGRIYEEVKHRPGYMINHERSTAVQKAPVKRAAAKRKKSSTPES